MLHASTGDTPATCSVSARTSQVRLVRCGYLEHRGSKVEKATAQAIYRIADASGGPKGLADDAAAQGADAAAQGADAAAGVPGGGRGAWRWPGCLAVAGVPGGGGR